MKEKIQVLNGDVHFHLTKVQLGLWEYGEYEYGEIYLVSRQRA